MADQIKVTSGGASRSAMLVTGPTDASGNAQGSAANPTVTTASQDTYTLASNQAIAAGGNTTPVAGVKRGVYVWDAQFTGTGPLVLQSLGADGVSWRNVASLNASGTLAGEVRIGANANLRLFSSTALTAVSSSLS